MDNCRSLTEAISGMLHTAEWYAFTHWWQVIGAYFRIVNDAHMFRCVNDSEAGPSPLDRDPRSWSGAVIVAHDLDTLARRTVLTHHNVWRHSH